MTSSNTNNNNNSANNSSKQINNNSQKVIVNVVEPSRRKRLTHPQHIHHHHTESGGEHVTDDQLGGAPDHNLFTELNSAYPNRPSVYAPQVQVGQPQGGLSIPSYFISPHTNIEATLNSMHDGFQQQLQNIHDQLLANSGSHADVAHADAATSDAGHDADDELQGATPSTSHDHFQEVVDDVNRDPRYNDEQRRKIIERLRGDA